MLCRDRSSPLCHIRVGLTSCIGAGHIVFFAGIDSTGNQVTCWTSNFVVAFLMLLFLCLFVYLFVWSYPPSFWFKDRLIYRVILFSWILVSFCLHSFYVCCNFPLFSFNFRSLFFGLCIFLFFGLLFWQIPFAGEIITFLRIIYSLQAGCVAVAALMQYFLMASFCWMLVEGIYIYLFVVKVYNITNKMHRYHGFCWGEEHCQEMRKWDRNRRIYLRKYLDSDWLTSIRTNILKWLYFLIL